MVGGIERVLSITVSYVGENTYDGLPSPSQSPVPTTPRELGGWARWGYFVLGLLTESTRVARVRGYADCCRQEKGV